MNPKVILQRLSDLVTEMENTSSSNKKKEILAKYSDIKDVLSMIYNPYLKTRLSSNNLKKNHRLNSSSPYSWLVLLEKLDSGEVSGNAAIAMANNVISHNSGYEEILYRIFDKNLKMRADASLINSVWPGCVPQFEVALAQKHNPKKTNFAKDSWLCSRKLDGLRCLALFDYQGQVSFFSRTGNEFHTLNVLKEELETFGWSNMVLDGEICIVDKDGRENFTAIMKEYNRKGHTIECPLYYIFDSLTMEEFKGEEKSPKLSARLREGMSDSRKEGDYYRWLEQHKVKNEGHLQDMIEEAAENGWEGLILRKDVPYQGKRSWDMQKVKQFHEAEYEVVGMSTGPFQIVRDGKEHKLITMTNVTILHKGHEVSVGSGFTITDREHYYKHPEDIIGKIITVQYFEETTNQQGGLSLRFPTVKAIHGDERLV